MKKKAPTIALALLVCCVAAQGQTVSNAGLAEYRGLLVDGTNPEGFPGWVVAVEQEGGALLKEPARWSVDGQRPDGTGTLSITIDRNSLMSDLGMTLVCEARTNADMVVQLLDDQDRVIALDLVGNVVALGEETDTDTFAVPLLDHPTATKVVLRRITGDVVIHSIVLFPMVIGLPDNPDLVSQLDMLKLLKQSLSPEGPTYKNIARIMAERSGATQAAEAEPVESWQENWVVVTNATERNMDKWGHHPFGWIPDSLPPYKFVNRPHYEDADVRRGLIAMHPMSQTEPSRIRFTGEVPQGRSIMTVVASGNVNGNGDCVLECVANGKPVGSYILNGDQWTTCRFDFSAHVGSPVDVELRNAAGGTRAWFYEHCYIDRIFFQPE